MLPVDEIRLNFNPASLAALNVVLAFLMFGIALDTKAEDFRRVLRMPVAMAVGIAWNFALFRWFVFRPSGPALTDQTSRDAAPSAGNGRGNARCAACVDDGRNLFSR